MSSPRSRALLVPIALDGASERAIQPALALAAGRPVVLFSWSSDEGEASAAKRYLVELAEDVDGDVGVQVACTADRDQSITIARVAQAAGATVCMASDRAGRWGQSLLGSSGMAVLEAAGQVILVGPNVRSLDCSEHRSVLVCVDGSLGSEQVLPLAREWAEHLGMRLRFVEVVEPGTPYPMEPSKGDDRPWTYLCRLALSGGEGKADGGRVAVLYGDPAEEIAHHAAQASLVAMATRARHGVHLALRRSTAMRVVHRSPCPVLLLRGEP